MKQEFEMTEEQYQAILDISRDKTPVIYVGTWLGLDQQERANKLWQTMGDEMGFDWDSAEPSSKGVKFFLAVPKPKVIPKTQTEIEMDKYDTIEKIVNQLEFCNYETTDNLHSLKDNIAFQALKRMIK